MNSTSTTLQNLRFRKRSIAIFILTMGMASLIVSCSPRVITDITNPSYSTSNTKGKDKAQQPEKFLSASDIKVYDEGQIVPNSAQVIGTVRVTEGGLTPSKRCKYPIVLDLAKQETAKAGGNALFVRQHQYPDVKSTCHRITCDMLHLTDTIVDPTQANPLMEKAAAEEKAYFDKQDKDDKTRELPLNYIGISGGYAWLDNEIWTEYGKEKTSPKGFDIALEYSHLWKIKGSPRPIYVGFSINGLLSLIDCDNLGPQKNESFQMTNYFIGADYKVAYKTSKSFVWHIGAGFGYAHSENDMHTSKSGGFAIHVKMGVDYLIGKHFGIGVCMDGIQSYYPKPKGWPSDKRYGIDHSGLNAHIGYYF